MNSNQNNLITLEKAARQLRLDPQWLESEALAGRIPYLQAGRKMLFNLEAVFHTLSERASQICQSPNMTSLERKRP